MLMTTLQKEGRESEEYYQKLLPSFSQMSTAVTLESVQTYKPLSVDSYEPGYYQVSSPPKREFHVGSTNSDVQYEKWFTTPALKGEMIKHIKYITVLAELHDQGLCSDRSAGVWTWLELCIYQKPEDKMPMTKKGLQLVWKCLQQPTVVKEYTWQNGTVYSATDSNSICGYLEEGNAIGIRLCSRFPGWEISARNGYIVIVLGEEIILRPSDRSSLYQSARYAINTEIINDSLQEFGNITHHTKTPQRVRATPRILGDAGTIDCDPLRVLSFDGGGVRGLMSLYMLKAVMEEAAPGKKPCEVFDMIAGTSTGGLIAIMLGRLEMTIEDCIQTYQQLSKEIFKARFSVKEIFKGAIRGYNSLHVERVLKKFVQDRTGEEDTLLVDSSKKCKILVTAFAANKGLVCLRSYTYTPRPINNEAVVVDASKFKIWEAARATSAAPTYFLPCKIDGMKYVDGGLAANNPTGWLLNEVLDEYGHVHKITCFLSIGTGNSPNAPVANIFRPVAFIKGISGAATETQLTHLLFKNVINLCVAEPGVKKYWRLNVNIGNPKPTTSKLKVESEMAEVAKLDDVNAMSKFYTIVKKSLEEQSNIVQEVIQSLRANV